MRKQLTKENFPTVCDVLIKREKAFKEIVKDQGYPPFWVRPNRFSTLVLTILEQQVSLAAAFAAYKKIKDKLGTITPSKLLLLTDDELRSCYFTRRKAQYVRGLAEAIVEKKISLKKFDMEDDETVREQLKALKGIGDWTVDVYLMHALRRADIFPTGDLALVNSVKMVFGFDKISKEELLALSEPWKPYRSVASMLLWHQYIKKKGIKVLH